MDTDTFNHTRDETLISRRPWYFLAVALFLLSVITRQPLAFLAALFTLIIGIVPEIWYRFALRNLAIRQQVSQHRAFFGETIALSLSIENRKLLPLPWLEVEDEIPVQLTLLTGRAMPTYKVNRLALVHTFSLWSFQRVTRRYRLRCTGRGVYTFGPATLRTGDPFGWLVREERASARETVLVYPLVAPLEAFGLPARHPFGEHTTPRRLLEDPLRVAGVREYVLGDDPRRIHWKATARAGALRSKVYEPSSQYRLLILLDINSYVEPWMGLDPDIQELTITIAASIALWALDEKYAVGLVANSLMMGLAGESPAGDENESQSATSTRTFMHHVRVPMASDSGQSVYLLSALGRLIPYFGSSMDALIDEEQNQLLLGATVVFVGSAQALHPSTVERLIDLQSHGAAVHLVLAGDPERNVDVETYDLPVHRAGGREVWHALIASASDETQGSAGRSSTSLYLD
ncbi:MAG TPA: DUF58 domain-containing protein [Ktedonobacteraceae bacterium]|nr:DUF58 domain-containing protein [Ktedonobacteraceae bacterium]